MTKCWNEKWLLFQKEQQRIKEKKKRQKGLFLKLCSIILSTLLFQKHKNPKMFSYLCLGPIITYEKSSWSLNACFLKAVNIRVVLSIESVYLHGYVECKHKPKHLSEFQWKNIHLTWVFLFHIWLSCKLRRLTRVKNRIFPFVCAWQQDF